MGKREKLDSDSTGKYKSKLIGILNRLKEEEQLTPQQYTYLKPTFNKKTYLDCEVHLQTTQEEYTAQTYSRLHRIDMI